MNRFVTSVGIIGSTLVSLLTAFFWLGAAFATFGEFDADIPSYYTNSRAGQNLTKISQFYSADAGTPVIILPIGPWVNNDSTDFLSSRGIDAIEDVDYQSMRDIIRGNGTFTTDPGVILGEGIVCPVAGSASFSDPGDFGSFLPSSHGDALSYSQRAFAHEVGHCVHKGAYDFHNGILPSREEFTAYETTLVGETNLSRYLGSGSTTYTDYRKYLIEVYADLYAFLSIARMKQTNIDKIYQRFYESRSSRIKAGTSAYYFFTTPFLSAARKSLIQERHPGISVATHAAEIMKQKQAFIDYKYFIRWGIVYSLAFRGLPRDRLIHEPPVRETYRKVRPFFPEG